MSHTFTVELEREEDGRWIAEIPTIPGALAYGATEGKALAAVEALALRVLADRLEHGETAPGPLEVSFVTHAA
jgi:predicted RNase H-like HicB family nuclease